MPQPPNYKAATDPTKNCGTCSYYYGLNSSCRRYNIKVGKTMTCSTWRNKAGLKKGANMSKPEYITLLSPAERAGAMKLGALMKLADAGIRADDIDDRIKSAGVSVSPSGIAKTIAIVSVLGGVPLGAAAHIVNRSIADQKNKEIELKEKIKYYRDATQGLETGLAGQQGAI